MREVAIVIPRFISIIILCIVIAACASSEVQREAAANVDLGVNNAKNLVDQAADSNIGDTYQNTNQLTKGLLLGGAAGALTGSLVTGIGIASGTVVGAILGGSYGAYIDANSSLEDRLDNRGISTVILGDQVLMVLPSWRIFQPLTPEIKPQAYSTLNMVARFINRFTKMLVKISVYTANTGNCGVDLALSQQQANSLEKVLLNYGLDARVLYAEGYGATHLVQRNSFKWDGNSNYRVEITLERLYA